MNEYDIESSAGIGIISLLVVSWFVSSLIFVFFVLSVLHESSWQFKIIIILFSISILALLFLLVLKIFSKKYNIKINNENDCIDINYGNKIITYKDIKDIQLLPEILKTETKHGYKIEDDKIMGYNLIIKYKNDSKISMVVYIGKSEKNKKNLESVFKLYREIYKIIYNEE